jgi:hypothetical protein
MAAWSIASAASTASLKLELIRQPAFSRLVEQEAAGGRSAFASIKLAFSLAQQANHVASKNGQA